MTEKYRNNYWCVQGKHWVPKKQARPERNEKLLAYYCPVHTQWKLRTKPLKKGESPNPLYTARARALPFDPFLKKLAEAYLEVKGREVNPRTLKGACLVVRSIAASLIVGLAQKGGATPPAGPV